MPFYPSTIPSILHLRMADALWERYAEIGILVDLLRLNGENNRADDQREALCSTALATYKQFCRNHHIDIEWVR